jgi:branched-chain amino acid transport system permease protein
MLTGQIINGLVSGAMYSLVAIGFTLILGVLDKLNFAHQEVFMLGGFAGVVIAPFASLWWSFPLAIALGGALGLLTEFVAFRRFTSQDAKIAASLSSLAIGLILVDAVQRHWGGEPVAVRSNESFFSARFSIAGIELLYIQVFIFAVTLALMAALHFLIMHTGFGRRIRAVAESPDDATLHGINVRRVSQGVFVISSALAALTGLLLAQRTGYASSEIGLTFGLKALAIMAIGGIGDMRGAVLGGLAIGVLEALTYHFGLGRLGEMTVWAAMYAVLIFRPAGLFATRGHLEQRA